MYRPYRALRCHLERKPNLKTSFSSSSSFPPPFLPSPLPPLSLVPLLFVFTFFLFVFFIFFFYFSFFSNARPAPLLTSFLLQILLQIHFLQILLVLMQSFSFHHDFSPSSSTSFFPPSASSVALKAFSFDYPTSQHPLFPIPPSPVLVFVRPMPSRDVNPGMKVPTCAEHSEQQ